MGKARKISARLLEDEWSLGWRVALRLTSENGPDKWGAWVVTYLQLTDGVKASGPIVPYRKRRSAVER